MVRIILTEVLLVNPDRQNSIWGLSSGKWGLNGLPEGTTNFQEEKRRKWVSDLAFSQSWGLQRLRCSPPVTQLICKGLKVFRRQRARVRLLSAALKWKIKGKRFLQPLSGYLKNETKTFLQTSRVK
jgi:hypothetical protein